MSNQTLPKPRTPLPSTFALSSYPKLSHISAGHLRHMHNLSLQRPGDWSSMSSVFPEQEWHDALRYQLSTMLYGAGLAHFHQLSAIRAPFKMLCHRLIEKMLHRDVWSYWYLTSQGGVACNPDLKVLRAPWADPVRRENIMYSGHLLLMTTVFAMLFDDDEWDQDGALVFTHDPVYYGLGEEVYRYSRTELQRAILAEMEREGWVGVCCEPNVVFVICNQFPLVALRLDSVRKGNGHAAEVLAKYVAAWKLKGVQFEGDQMQADMYMVQQRQALPFGEIAMSAWAAGMLNTWNPTFSRNLYPHLLAGYLTKKPNGRINLNSAPVATRIRELASSSNSSGSQPTDPTSPELFTQAWDDAPTRAAALSPLLRPGSTSSRMPTKPVFGCVLSYVSEVGPRAHLAGLLQHADEMFGLQWRDGGCYYARGDDEVVVDDDGEWRFCDSFTGNALIPYARLNVQDGLRKMYEHPWTGEEIRGRPWVDGLGGFEEGVDFLRAIWDDEVKAMVLTLRCWNGTRTVRPVVRQLKAGVYDVYVGGWLVKSERVLTDGGAVEVEFQVGEDECDLVVLRDKCE